ncbi:MAG: helix-turn-helix domain-containing protein [Patescibacteria group bacterium]|nr:helix-turn-helix domain-containing protein [Patescibacteria group bacterium]
MNDTRLPKMLLRIEEAAHVLSISRSQAYKLIASGEIPVVRLGKSVRIPIDALRERIGSAAYTRGRQ